MQIKSRLMVALATVMISVASAHAGTLTITFDTPDQIGNVGDTLQYFGTITNNSASTIFLNSDSLNLAGDPSDFSITDDFGNTPFSIDAGQTSTDIELFDVTINNPFTDGSGTFAGTYVIFGGADGGAQDVLVDPAASFSTTVTPEPGTYMLLLTGISGIALIRRRKSA
jgi:hypothetical protein